MDCSALFQEVSYMSVNDVIRGTAAETNQSNSRGWVIGSFFPHDSLPYDRDHEVKLWHYDANPNYGVKGFPGTEFIVAYGGRIRINASFMDGTKAEYVLDGASHDYILLPAHVKTVIAEECPAFGVTVRWK